MNKEQKELLYSDVARYALKLAMLTNIYQFEENGKIDIALDEVLEKLADLMQTIRREISDDWESSWLYFNVLFDHYDHSTSNYYRISSNRQDRWFY